MPRHQQVTNCLRGGPVTSFCSCQHCTLGVCSVCGAYEGSLTTDCPGETVSFDKQQEIYTTNLDFTDARGWHQGESMKQRSPRFVRNPNEFPCPACRVWIGKPCNQEVSGVGPITHGADGISYHMDRINAASMENEVERLRSENRRLQEMGKLQSRTVERLLDRLRRIKETATTETSTSDVKHFPRVAWSKDRGYSAGGCSCGWQVPPNVTDADDAYAMHMALVRTAPIIENEAPTELLKPTPARFESCSPLSGSIDWSTVDQTTNLKHDLAQKAIAWVLADRIADQHSADLARIEDASNAYMLPRKGQDPDAKTIELLEELEFTKAGFKLADQRAVKCDEEFRQAARKLVEALEKGPPAVLTMEAEIVGEKEEDKP